MDTEKGSSKNIGIDLGGTWTRVALVDKNKILDVKQMPTDVKDPVANFSWVVDYIKEQKAKQKVELIGISSPGPIDIFNGIVLETPNLREKWINFNMKKFFEDGTGITTLVENDANAQAYALALFKHKEHKVVQFFTLSTGLGAGLVIDGKVMHGERGFAQEIANIPLGVEGFKSGILFENAIESIGSGTGILAYAKHLGSKAKSAKEVFELAKTEEQAKKVVKAAQYSWARLFAITIAFNNPGVIVIGGGVANHNKKEVQEAIAMAEQMTYSTLRGTTKYLIAEAGENDGLIGAANLKP